MTRRAGFTLVEVMVSLGVMTVGAMALLAMQQQTTRANVQAREMTIATQIAQTWIERLKIDAVRWAITSGTSTDAPTLRQSGAIDLGATSFLKDIAVAGNEGVFLTIPQPAPNMPLGSTLPVSNAFDYYGNDVILQGNANPTFVYCAAYRLTWVYIDRLIRADVRVWWPREGSGANIVAEFPACAANPALFDPTPQNPAGQAPARYHVVYLSTSIRNLQYQ